MTGDAVLREQLFADQDLADVLAQTDGDNEFLVLCRDALAHRQRGDLDGARDRLVQAAQLPELEARAALLACRALRGLGLEFLPETADAVLGVVVEVPVEDKLDTLAIYDDGTARYFNQGALSIVQSHTKGPFAEQAHAVITEAQRVAQAVLPGDRATPRPDEHIRIVLLTPGGARLVDLTFEQVRRGLFRPLFDATTGLLVALVESVLHPA
jgi:hypothetical protein